MASRPSPSEAAGRLAAGLGAHRVSLASRPLAGVGSVGRAAMRFGALTFLSRSARRRELARDSGAGRLLVRPPDYWAGPRPDHEGADGSTSVQRTGDAAFDALLAKRRAAQARRAPRRSQEPRGLPSTVHRRGVSLAGPLTGPGSVLRRLTPTPVPPVPNPATTGGKLTTVSTPTPQAPRRTRGSNPGGARSPSAQRSPSRAHRPPSGPTPPSAATRVRTRTSTSPSPSAPGQSSPALPGLQRLERLADVATPTRDALKTPAFDALLDTVSGHPAVETSPTDDQAVTETVARYDPISRPTGIDESVLARWFDSSTAADVEHRPAVGVRAARPLPIASVSVHAAAPAHAAQRRLSFGRSSALSGRSPWDDVRRQPVGGGLAPAAVAGAVAARAAATTRDLGASGPAQPASAPRDPAHAAPIGRRPGTRELRRARAGAPAAWIEAGSTSTATASLARRGTPASVPAAAGPVAPHGITLPRVLRRSPAVGRSSAPGAKPAAAEESLADAVRRVFGDPTASGSSSAEPGAALAAVMRAPVAPPVGVPASSSPTTRTRADAASTGATVIPLRRQPAATTAAPSTPAHAERIAPVVDTSAFATTMATHPGALFAAPVLADGSSLSRRSVARPGTVLGRATTHSPLAHTDLARLEARVARVATPSLDVSRLPVAAAASTGPARDVGATASALRRSARRDPVQEATIAHEVALAVHRETARVAVRRLPLGATGLALPTRRTAATGQAPAPTLRRTAARSTSLAPAADGATAATAAPTTLAQRVAALAEASPPPFELVRRVPVAPMGTVVVRTEANGATPAVRAATAPAATAATPLRRGTASAPATTDAAARAANGATGAGSTDRAARIGSESTPNGLVRRIPVASPAVATAGQRGAAQPPEGAPTLAQRVAALAAADASGGQPGTPDRFDLVRRLPVGAPTAVLVGSGRESQVRNLSNPPRTRTAGSATMPAAVASTATSSLALPSPAAARAHAVTAAAPLLRRSVHLPNATTTAEAVAAERSQPTGAIAIRNPLAQRLAALTAATGSTGAVRDLPVAAPTAIVRRSMAIPTAPTSHRAAAQVLPGIRTTPTSIGAASGLVARRSNGGAPSTSGSTADRLRELVATGAFDGGAPVRRMPVAPPVGAAAATAAAQTPAARATAAQRFDDVIRRTPAARQDKPQPLPARFRPLAERIVGPKFAVRVVHGAVTRAALEAAGHEAATTDSTIHLPTRPDSSARTMSIVAHELEHVAVPSAVARFHGGVDSPEERRAARTEAVVRRLGAEISRRGGAEQHAGTSGLPVAGLPAFGRTGSAAAHSGGDDTVHRTPAGAPPAPPAPPPQQNRRPQPSRPGTPPPAPPPPPASASAAAATIAAAAGSGSSESSAPAALSPAQLSAIIRAVEDRLLEEIERRGGLRRGSF